MIVAVIRLSTSPSLVLELVCLQVKYQVNRPKPRPVDIVWPLWNFASIMLAPASQLILVLTRRPFWVEYVCFVPVSQISANCSREAYCGQ